MGGALVDEDARAQGALFVRSAEMVLQLEARVAKGVTDVAPEVSDFQVMLKLILSSEVGRSLAFEADVMTKRVHQVLLLGLSCGKDTFAFLTPRMFGRGATML